jgi:hypothetical protein
MILVNQIDRESPRKKKYSPSKKGIKRKVNNHFSMGSSFRLKPEPSQFLLHEFEGENQGLVSTRRFLSFSS